MLMSKEHASHDYGSFTKVAPKYRKQLASEMSLITTQDLSISSTLGEIAAAESSLEGHAQKCQDDVEHTFEELFSVLQACKRAMKDETTAYYSSLTGAFDQQKERLKDIQSKIKSVAASVDTTLQDNDQSFLARMESTFDRINNLQKKFQAASLTVAKPQPIVSQAIDVDMLQRYIKTKWVLRKPVDATMCLIDTSSFMDAMLYIGQETSFTLTLHDLSGNTCIEENEIDVNLLRIQDNHSIKGKLELLSQGRIKVTLTPQRRGQHQLNAKVNGAHIKNSPFTVTVYIPPKLPAQPVSTISGLKRPASLHYSETEDTVFAVIIDDDRVINLKLDPQLQ